MSTTGPQDRTCTRQPGRSAVSLALLVTLVFTACGGRVGKDDRSAQGPTPAAPSAAQEQAAGTPTPEGSASAAPGTPASAPSGGAAVSPGAAGPAAGTPAARSNGAGTSTAAPARQA